MGNSQLLFLPLVLSACGAEAMVNDSVAAATEGEPSPKARSDAEIDLIVPPNDEGRLPADLWIGCKNGPEFQAADLEQIVPLADGDPNGVAEAIEVFLSDGEGQFWPQEGWLILRQTSSEMLLVNKRGTELSFMTVRRVNGEWKWDGAQGRGSCPLHYLVPEGFNAVDWRVDPEASPNHDTKLLRLLVSERECVSGQAIGDRLRGPQVVMTDDAVRIAFTAVPPPGDAFNCPGNPESAVVVHLPAPLGDRKIIEGLAIGISLEDHLP